ncbi:hypothetical protein CDAR_297931 [Caerostris darwini]|uniref:Ankyrin repeat protein n=1 Tax=Caerostris darwini TaxID=1538125 RepID=A0AAV4PP76_9ARAC|nr:hypothetical protein CDAR_297931 [Caerostris darwini]
MNNYLPPVEDLPDIFNVSNVRDLRRLLDSGVSINEEDEFGYTPLYRIIKRDIENFELIREFVLNGADVNYEYLTESAALHLALLKFKKDPKVIKLLLENGAVYKKMDTFLDFTREGPTDYYECIKLLIRYQFLRKSHLVGSKRNFESHTGKCSYHSYSTITGWALKPINYCLIVCYLNECALEICRMRETRLFDYFSLLNILTTKHLLMEVKDPLKKEEITYKIIKECAKHYFPMYQDMIAERLGRQSLLDSLNNKWFFVITNEKKVIGRLDVIYEVNKYLSDLDLLNVAIALEQSNLF